MGGMVETAGNNGWETMTGNNDVKGLGIGSKARRVRPERRTVTCDGVRGVLVKGEEGWALDNEPEVRTLMALGGSDQALDRLRAMAKTLDAGLADGRLLSRLSGRLSAIAAVEEAEEVCEVRMPGELIPAVAFACVHLKDPNSLEWLAWMLSVRLEGNLVSDALPGPGLRTFRYLNDQFNRGFNREARWVGEMPSAFWDRLSSHEVEQMQDAAAASDPRTGAKELKRLADQSSTRMAVEQAAVAVSGPRAKTRAREMGLSGPLPDEVVLDLVASHPNTPAKVLVGMAQRSAAPTEVRWRVAQNKSLSPWALSRLAKLDPWQIRRLAASHPNMGAAALAGLAGDEEEQVRAAAARNPATPEAVLREFARDAESEVRAAVGLNPSAPIDVLETLSSDRIKTVRSSVVSNPRAPVDLLSRRAEDRATSVRQRVAYSSDVSGSVLEKLAEDRNPQVRKTVAYNENTPSSALEGLAADPVGFVRGWAAGNSSTPVGALRKLAVDPVKWVREQAAGNASAPVDLLKVLAADPMEEVRCEVARNASTPVDVLKSLAADPSWGVRVGVAGNESAPVDGLRILASDPRAWVRARVAGNESAPADLVEALAADSGYLVRDGVVANQSASTKALGGLADDEDYRIRARAAAVLRSRRESLAAGDAQGAEPRGRERRQR